MQDSSPRVLLVSNWTERIGLDPSLFGTHRASELLRPLRAKFRERRPPRRSPQQQSMRLCLGNKISESTFELLAEGHSRERQ